MIILSSAEQADLHRLVTDGAWSDAEAAQLPALSQMLDEGILQRIHTAIGWLTVLTPAGLKLLGIPQRRWHSIGSRLNDAYVRLSLEALQWPIINESSLLELDTSNRMVAVMTPFGPALVTGKLPAGYSPQGLRAIRNRLKSTILSRDFMVVCLTPSPRRGQTFAENEWSWCKVVHVVPDLADLLTKHPPAFLRFPSSLDVDANFLHEIHRRGYTYGDEWLKIMNSNQEERLEMFLKALECDGVISEQQLHRHYALTHECLPNIPYVGATLAPIHSDPDFMVNTRFYLREKKCRNHQWTTHAHAATITEMRMLLNVPADPKIWKRSESTGEKLLRGNRSRANKPDAIFMGEFAPEAIEADTGSYTTKLIERKISSFRDQGYDEIIWGVPMMKRRNNLSAAHPIRVLRARWF